VAAAQASDDAGEDDAMALVKRVQVAHEKLLTRGVKTYVSAYPNPLPGAALGAGLRSTVRLRAHVLRAVSEQCPRRCERW